MGSEPTQDEDPFPLEKGPDHYGHVTVGVNKGLEGHVSASRLRHHTLSRGSSQEGGATAPMLRAFQAGSARWPEPLRPILDASPPSTIPQLAARARSCLGEGMDSFPERSYSGRTWLSHERGDDHLSHAGKVDPVLVPIYRASGGESSPFDRGGGREIFRWLQDPFLSP